MYDSGVDKFDQSRQNGTKIELQFIKSLCFVFLNISKTDLIFYNDQMKIQWKISNRKDQYQQLVKRTIIFYLITFFYRFSKEIRKIQGGASGTPIPGKIVLKSDDTDGL